jgi:polyisoprenoid-binding protein YceI
MARGEDVSELDRALTARGVSRPETMTATLVQTAVKPADTAASARGKSQR